MHFIMNIYELIEAEETRLAENRVKRASASIEGHAICDNAERENRNLTAREDARTNALFRDIEQSKAAEGRIQTRMQRLEAIRDEEESMDSNMRATPIPANLPKDNRSDRTVSVSVGREARTYNPGSDPTGALFIRDLIDDFTGRGRGESAQRIDAHVRESRIEHPGLMQRTSSGIGTSAVSGLVVPQYLTDMVAPAIANLRPYADNANKHPLPASGMSVNISRITTPTSAALQASELATVSFTDADDTLLTVPVLTAAGQQLVSRQAIERGTGVEDVLVADLLRRIAVVVDTTMLTQASVGALNTAGVTTYTDATPTQEEMFPFFYMAMSSLESTLRGVANVDGVFMTPARWNWFSSKLTTSWPLVNNGQMSPYQSGKIQSRDYGSNVRGVLPNGLPVYTDANIPTNLGGGTNEDRIIFAASAEVHLWEDPNAPVVIRAEQPSVASLGVNLVAYQYFAFTHGRYVNNPQVMAGTGQVVTTALAGF